MTYQRATTEVIASTVDEAIKNGLAELGLPADAVDIEILDEGSRGIFGLGTRMARVRLSVKETHGEIEAAPTMEPEAEPEAAPAEKTPAAASLKDDIALHVARETISELLERMNIKAKVSAQLGEIDEHSGSPVLLVDITGDDLSILIGKRSETLNALQYIARLIVNKELGRSVTLLLDVEGFRLRRDRQLRSLAQRMADQAMKTGRRQLLEPMPANERRIIHMELRSHPGVTTESQGEEPHRKVTIIPKE